jgi:hypothetical protein
MDTIGAFDAKTHLAALLDRPRNAAAKLSHDEIVEGMRALRKRVKRSKTSVRDMVNEGRRY